MNSGLRRDGAPPCRALLLDFGGVIQKSFFETRTEIENLLHIPRGTLSWAGPFDPESDPLWRQVVSGGYSERDYWGQRAREVGNLIGEDWRIQDFCRKHNDLPANVALRSEILALISDVKRAGLKFGILTNELELFHGKNWTQAVPFADEIDVLIDATHTRILKPDPRAYELARAAFSLTADEIVFVDDQPRNVAGGCAAGFHSIYFDIVHPRQSVQQIRLAVDV
jgi:putative hydrolase of the HAD superfamily